MENKVYDMTDDEENDRMRMTTQTLTSTKSKNPSRTRSNYVTYNKTVNNSFSREELSAYLNRWLTRTNTDNKKIKSKTETRLPTNPPEGGKQMKSEDYKLRKPI